MIDVWCMFVSGREHACIHMLQCTWTYSCTFRCSSACMCLTGTFHTTTKYVTASTPAPFHQAQSTWTVSVHRSDGATANGDQWLTASTKDCISLLSMSVLFETLDHNILLQCLVSRSVSGSILIWFQFWMTTSRLLYCMQAYSRGCLRSALEPLLFTIYIWPLGSSAYMSQMLITYIC